MADTSGPLSDDEVLWRRILSSWIVWEEGKPRPTSEAFKDRLDFKLSAFIAKETTIRRLLRGRPKDSIVSFKVGHARALGLRVQRDHDPDFPGHVVVVPAPKSSAARKLAQRAEWVKFRDPRPFQLRAAATLRGVVAAIRSLLE